ncbi:HAD-superfamily hydrolase, subfamily IIB [Magnetococcus marinus MC-1]|uniref:HAD-superfamily hydrolase, subfamily IIB n=1 Tax=Magnetococcus marinus (strain ATCC BAA-1437 / JCM 17883 / MC-1) TaxID=156889 RepID=A0L9Z9_MAGMM|nr:HAD-IIB family hydrolase [Magnetococcus marinus]ABK44792.1 HAD-superfamily hydrolase, subfamily IIB [Magnetococcus marinus MC-1]
MSTPALLLCTDLDRTLLPNGGSPEPHGARHRFQQLVKQPHIQLSYLSGRDHSGMEEAIKTYQLPTPRFMVADAGGAISLFTDGHWQSLPGWRTILASTWSLELRHQIPLLLRDLPLTPRCVDRQSRFKQSYSVAPDLDKQPLMEQISVRLKGLPIEQRWSRDEESGTRLLNIIPSGINKLTAIRMLQQHCAIDDSHTLFAGDSANDLSVFASSVPSILVGNADKSVREQALYQCQQAGVAQSLYLARENYADGICEGFHHFYGP